MNDTLTREDARRLTARIRSAAVHLDQLLVQAYEQGAWAALGYSSFAAYCAGELPELRMVKLRAPERQARVAALSAVDPSPSVRDLAAATGAGLATIHRDLADVARPATVTGADGRRRQSRTGQGGGSPVPAGPFTGTLEALLAARGPLTALEVETATRRRSATVAPALHRLAAAGRITYTPGARRGQPGLYGPRKTETTR